MTSAKYFMALLLLVTLAAGCASPPPEPETQQTVALRHIARGQRWLQVHKPDSSEKSLLRAAEIAEAVDDVESATLAYNELATVAYQSGRLARAESYIDRALSYVRTSKGTPVPLQAIVLSNAGCIKTSVDKDDEARRLYEDSLALCRSLGDRAGEARVIVNISELDLRRGDASRALALVQEALALLALTEDLTVLGSAHFNLGVIYEDKGDKEAAASDYHVALEAFREAEFPMGLMSAHAALGRLASQSNDMDEARHHWETALRIAKTLSNDVKGRLALEQLIVIARRVNDTSAIQRYEEQLSRIGESRQ